MPVTLIIRKEVHSLEGPIPLKDAFINLELSTQTHLAVRDGEMRTEMDILQEGEVVKLIPVISGG